MKIIKNTLEPHIEIDSDPGVYPSGAGGSPLPSTRFVESVDGQIEIEFDNDDLPDGQLFRVTEWLSEFGSDIEHDLPHGVKVTKWHLVNFQWPHATITVEDFDGGNVEDNDDDYEPSREEFD